MMIAEAFLVKIAGFFVPLLLLWAVNSLLIIVAWFKGVKDGIVDAAKAARGEKGPIAVILTIAKDFGIFAALMALDSVLSLLLLVSLLVNLLLMFA